MTNETGALPPEEPETSAAPTDNEAPRKSTVTERMAKARAAKAVKRTKRIEAIAEEGILMKKSEIDELLARLAALERARVETIPEVEITTDTLAKASGVTQKLRPGQIINISGDPSKPDLRKVRWTKASIEETYEMIDFVPQIGLTVVPHGVPYNLAARQRVKVPSIVVDLYETEMQRREHMNDAYDPPSFIEIYEQARRALRTPGTPVWGRLHIVGVGLDVGADIEAPSVPEEAAGAQA